LITRSPQLYSGQNVVTFYALDKEITQASCKSLKMEFLLLCVIVLWLHLGNVLNIKIMNKANMQSL
jgi:hypothetical protein